VHERLQAQGNTGYLNGAILHHTHRDLSDYLAKIDRYTSLEAEAWFHQGVRVGARDLLRALAVFPWLYVFKSGWRDGILGLVVSLFQSFYVFLRCAKIWERQQQTGNNGEHGAEGS
jgi:hypothetical protein